MFFLLPCIKQSSKRRFSLDRECVFEVALFTAASASFTDVAAIVLPAKRTLWHTIHTTQANLFHAMTAVDQREPSSRIIPGQINGKLTIL